MRWYRWFYIERPFPWLPILAVAAGVVGALAILAGTAYLALTCLDCPLIDDF